MSIIPPNSLASIIQSAGAARTAAQARDAADAADGEKTRQFTDSLTRAIDASDGSNQVHADAEGAGGFQRHAEKEIEGKAEPRKNSASEHPDCGLDLRA